MQHDDDLNDDGYPMDEQTYGEIPDEWLDEEEAYWADPDLNPEDSGNYDPVEGSDNEWDDEPVGLEYDGYNDPDNY